jgi:hypothetical protein
MVAPASYLELLTGFGGRRFKTVVGGKKMKRITILIALILLSGSLLLAKRVQSRNDEISKMVEFTATAVTSAAPSGITNTLFSYQGQLLDGSGNPITGNRSITFRLYNDLTGGAECWSETQTVAIANGLFNVMLGASTPIDAGGECFAGDLYLELEIGGQTLLPRELLTSMNVPDGSRLGTAVLGQHLSFSNGANFVNQPAAAIYGPDNGVLHLAADPTPLLSDGRWFRGGWIWMSSIDSTVSPGSVRIHLAQDSVQGNNPSFEIRKNQENDISEQLLTVDHNGNMVLPNGNLTVANNPGVPQFILDNAEVGYRWRALVTDGGHLRFDMDDGTGWQNMFTLRNDGTCSLSSLKQVPTTFLDNEQEKPCGTLHMDQLETNSLQTGAIIEANLPLPVEHQQLFNEGDVLCLSAKSYELELCTTANDRLVQAVANSNGQAIVMGAEPIKVTGEVRVGDILVTSPIPGHAMVNNNPTPGAVIGQALEEFSGESGLIQAMIRKW